VTDGNAAAAGRQLTLQAVDEIRELIFRHVLLPGEKVRQVELAQRVGVSRSPLREALRTLESEGMVSYEPNRGYVISRLDADDLAQIYRMRKLLEFEILQTIKPQAAAAVAEIAQHNADMVEAIEAENISAILRANREFHFSIFALSPLKLFRREVRRLWQLSEGYRATYLWLPETRERIVQEHTAIIEALASQDIGKLVELCTQHRDQSETVVVGLLSNRSPG
jgi:DNA-binding GntR family transcriptional regulator